MTEQSFLSLNQVAKRLGVSVESVYQDIKGGTLPSISMHNDLRVPLDELEVCIKILESDPGIRPSSPKKQIGVVARYIPRGGSDFGFITAEDGTDIFLGGTFIRDLRITTGDLVEFTTVPGQPYPAARDVKLIKKTKFKEARQAAQLYKEALDAQQQEYFELARRHFRQAIDRGAFLLVYTTFAEMERALGRSRSALVVVYEAMKIYSRVGKLYYLAAELLLELEDAKLALFWLEKGIEQAPSFTDNHMLYLQVLMSQGSIDDFQKAVNHAKSLDKYQISPLPNNQLLRFLRGHQLPHDAYIFFIRIGFDITLIESSDQHVDFLITARKPEYIDTYGLYKKILARCFLQDANSWEMINAFRREWQNQVIDDPDLNLDISFAILEDVTPLRNALYRILADSKDAIVPLDKRILSSDHPTVACQDQLSNWLSRRDLYAEHFPVSGRQFFGREVEIQGLMRSISEGRNIGIFGLRKVGKTSVLYQIRDKAKRDLIAYIDLQSFPPGVHSTSYLYWIIASNIYKQAHKKYPEICEDLDLRLGSASSYDYLHQPQKRNASLFDKEIKIILRRLAHIVPDAKIVILIDELERMLPTGGKKGFPGFADFFAHIRGLAQQERGRLVSGIAAANPLVSEKARWGNADNPVFRYYQELYLPLLAKPDCKQMITELGRRMAVSYTDESLEFIYDQTGGHPFLVRLFCSHVLAKSPQRPIQVNREMLFDSVDTFIFDQGSTFREILERLEKDFPLEYDLLLFIVSGVESKQELSSLVTEPVDQALRHLIGYQLISHNSKTYKVKISLLTKWLESEGII